MQCAVELVDNNHSWSKVNGRYLFSSHSVFSIHVLSTELNCHGTISVRAVSAAVPRMPLKLEWINSSVLLLTFGLDPWVSCACSAHEKMSRIFILNLWLRRLTKVSVQFFPHSAQSLVAFLYSVFEISKHSFRAEAVLLCYWGHLAFHLSWEEGLRRWTSIHYESAEWR